MGQVSSCSSAGSLLMVAAGSGDLVTAKLIVKKQPNTTMFLNYKDKSSPLMQAAASGHLELVQLILETCLMVYGPEKAKRCCLDRPNIKNQTALQMACKHGHTEIVEYLIANGADPTVLDKRRFSSCLHLAALYGHSECVNRLLSARLITAAEGPGLPVGQVTCQDPVTNTATQLLNCHNGWGVTALHMAVYQGGVATARALLKHGATLESLVQPPCTDSSFIRCTAGATVLHIAAQNSNVNMVKLLLEAQEGQPGLELRSMRDGEGMRPQDYAQRSRNLILAHLLDERLPVHLLRQVWLNYSVDPGTPPRHQTLGHMLQKLKLVFSLEVINAQRYISLADAIIAEGQLGSSTTEATGDSADPAVPSPPTSNPSAAPAGGTTPELNSSSSSVAVDVKDPRAVDQLKLKEKWSALHQVMRTRSKWVSRVEQIQSLLKPVTVLHDSLQKTLAAESSTGGKHTAQDVLDFILCLLITNRNVSAVLHAAKRLVSAAGVQAPEMQTAWAALQASNAKAPDGKTVEAGRRLLQSPSSASDAQHSVGLLLTALKAVETCLHAAVHLAEAPASELHNTHLLFASPGMMAMPAAGGLTDLNMAGIAPVPAPAAAPSVDATTNSTIPDAPAPGSAPLTSVVPPRTIHHRHPNISYSNPVFIAAQAYAPDDSRAGLGPDDAARNDPGSGRLHIVNAQDGRAFSPNAGAAHWSSHLHTLIAQLQWDISVQRTTRRRRVDANRLAASSRATRVAMHDAPTTQMDFTALADTITTQVMQLHPVPGQTPGASNMMPAGISDSVVSASRSLRAQLLQRQSGGSQDAAAQPESGGLVARTSFVQPATHEHSAALEAVAGGTSGGHGRQPSWDALLSMQHPGVRAGDDASAAPAAGLMVVQPGSDGVTPTTALAPTSNRSRLACLSAALGPMPQSNNTVQPSVDSGSVNGGPDYGSTAHGQQSSKAKPGKGVAPGTGDLPDWQQGAKAGARSDSDDDSMSSGSEDGLCAICMDAPMAILVTPCQHGVCVNCALQLTIKGKNAPCCPFCRCTIAGFEQRCAGTQVATDSLA